LEDQAKAKHTAGPARRARAGKRKTSNPHAKHEIQPLPPAQDFFLTILSRLSLSRKLSLVIETWPFPLICKSVIERCLAFLLYAAGKKTTTKFPLFFQTSEKESTFFVVVSFSKGILYIF
jgi:hypothetical protein